MRLFILTTLNDYSMVMPLLFKLLDMGIETRWQYRGEPVNKTIVQVYCSETDFLRIQEECKETDCFS